MTLRILDRCKTTTTSTGTGAIVCSAAAAAGCVSLSSLAVGDTFPYAIGDAGAAEWECGVGTITVANTFTRTPTSSSNNNALVNFSAGTKTVMCVPLGATLAKFERSTSVRVVYTSSTCISDADVSLGSTTFGTDQRAKLQALLDLALQGPLLLIWDGAYGVSPDPVVTDTALRINSNTTIQALPGCGAILRGSAESSLLSNANRNDGRVGNAANSTGNKNISIIGGLWNGAGVTPSVLQMFGIDGLVMRNISLLNSASFHLHAGNWRNVVGENIMVDKGPGSSIYNDGLHFCGPGQYLSLTNTTVLNCGDDNIALNADDAWVGNTRAFQPRGNITDVVIDGLNMVSNLYGIRILSGGSRVDNIDIRSVRGSTKGYWLVIDNFQPAQTLVSGPGNIGSVSISDVDMDTDAGGALAACAVIDCKIEQLTLKNVRRAKFLDTSYASIQFGAKADVGQLTIDGYKSNPLLGGTSLANQIVFLSGSKVAQAQILNGMFYAPSAVSGNPINVNSGATIGQLVLFGNQAVNFTDFLTNAGSVTNLFAGTTVNFINSAAGVPASSWTLQEATHYAENTEGNTLTFTGPYTGTVSTARRGTADAFGGNVRVSAKMRFSGTANPALVGALFVRGANSIPLANITAGTALSFNMHGGTPGVRLNAIGVAGQDTTLNAALSLDTDYIATLTVKNTGTSIREYASVVRVSDGHYLQPGGTFAATAANCHDRARTGAEAAAGEYGVYSYAEAAATIVFTDFAAVAAP